MQDFGGPIAIFDPEIITLTGRIDYE